MRKITLTALFVASLAPTNAAAAGGMGDPSAHTREMNAICDAQRRGQGPLYPDMCLPEYPAGPPYEVHARRAGPAPSQ